MVGSKKRTTLQAKKNTQPFSEQAVRLTMQATGCTMAVARKALQKFEEPEKVTKAKSKKS